MNNIAKYRKAKGLTQSELAAETDCHWVTISKLERGEIELTVGWMQRLAPLLGVVPSALMGEPPPPDYSNIPAHYREIAGFDRPAPLARIEAKLDAIMAHCIKGD